MNNNDAGRAALPRSFEEAYTWALGHILRFEEIPANGRLNSTFGFAASFVPKDNVWKTILEDLSDNRTKGLVYGDYLSDSSYPWIRDPKTLAVVVRHATMLGEDKAVIDRFIERTEKAYGTRPDPAALRLVA